MTDNFQKQMERYQKQKTEVGEMTQRKLDEMASAFSKVLNKPVKSGRLQPMINAQTNTITKFIEK